MEIDIYKHEGQILFKVEKLSEFADAPAKTRRQSDVVFVHGLPWRILAINRESSEQIRHLSFFLQCNVDNPDPSWNCVCVAKLKVLSQKEGTKAHVRQFAHLFNAEENDWGFAEFLSFEELMAPEKGFYDEQSDSIVLAAEFTVDAPLGHKKILDPINFAHAKPNATITVNNEAVAVNSHVLSFSSAYFERYFFDDRYTPAENIELPPSTTVEDFKRMLATLPPERRRLDDGCVEAVLVLADRFFMDNVMVLGRSFLLNESNKPRLSKFRIAHKHGWKEMKEQILQSMQLDDFNGGVNFLKNATEFAMLDDEAKAVLSAHHAKLVSDNCNFAKK